MKAGRFERIGDTLGLIHWNYLAVAITCTRGKDAVILRSPAAVGTTKDLRSACQKGYNGSIRKALEGV